jgi:hypothetical protein
MRILPILILLLSFNVGFSQTEITILPIEVSIFADPSTSIFMKKAKAEARVKQRGIEAEALTLEFQEHTDYILDEFELAYVRKVSFLRNDDAIPDSLKNSYREFVRAMSGAIDRNQIKKDNGLSVTIASKGFSNRALREKNVNNLRKTSKPLEDYFKSKLFLYVKIIGMQSSHLQSKGIYGGIRMQTILVDASSGETMFFKTFSNGPMRTDNRANTPSLSPSSSVQVRKKAFQSRLKNMLKAAMDKANRLISKD